MQPLHSREEYVGLSSADQPESNLENHSNMNINNNQIEDNGLAATPSRTLSSESIEMDESAPLETQERAERIASTIHSSSRNDEPHQAPSDLRHNHHHSGHHGTSTHHPEPSHLHRGETILDRLDDVLDISHNENVLSSVLMTEHHLRRSHDHQQKAHHHQTPALEDAPSQSKVCDNADLVIDQNTTFPPSSTTTSEVSMLDNKLESSFNDLKVTAEGEVATTSEKGPKSAAAKALLRKRIINLILFFLGTMCFKFSYETLSGAIGLTILTRLENHPLGATTILSLLTITFGISQSISSTLVEGFLKQVRATRLYSMALLFFSLLILTMIVLEATTGGTLTEAGYWSPWIIFPIYVFIGFSIGVIEVVRKIIPASILGNSKSVTLKRLNASIHIIYECAGTVGAFLSSVFIEKLGSIYALCHMPLFFTVGAVFLFFISVKGLQQSEDQTETVNPSASATDMSGLTSPRPTWSQRVKSFMVRVGVIVKNYFKSMFIGAKIVLANRYYIWLIPCFVLPQTLHRLIENIFLPAYAKMILKKGSYSGIMLGGSNFGELLGAGLLFLLAKKVKKPTIWILMDALFLNLMWIFPFLTFDETTNNNLIFAICIVPAMVLTSGSYAAGDCTQIAYIQSTLSDEVNEQTGVNELAAVMSFLYSCYIIITTFVVFGLSQGIDRFNAEKRPEFGFMTICIVLTVLSVIISTIYLLFAKVKPSKEEEEEQQQKEAETKEFSENPINDSSRVNSVEQLAPKEESSVAVHV
ncbi:hypothetical protein FDP41_006349 [Naegleria fowleri]|uniref:Uncharacterized protein n=1 Tax=Naegleria fowleri TaxID=5763 RepID=A0A6A5BMS7_NAEFO|nr:uncharacterized protein FDP41_006349 [Naegleria fowleri]KAF0974875.1 hypothetical protein FDP41_006349 [Naegleria fowleri]